MNTSETKFLTAEIAAMEWMIYATRRKAGKGIPHSRWLFIPDDMAWKPSYPETSAYAIENFFLRNVHFPETQHTISFQIGDWLLEQQSADGFFYSGLKKQKPSLFNTAQIIEGLSLLYQNQQNEKYYNSILKAHRWFISQIREDGVWQEGLYVHAWFPVYYAHALWKYLQIDLKYFDGENLGLLTKSYVHLFDKAQRDLFSNSGFYPNKPSLSHTLAYSLEGLLECAKILQNVKHIHWIYDTLFEFSERSSGGKKFPARFLNNTTWDASFICTTGHAQFASLFYWAYEAKNASWAFDTAEHLLQSLVDIQFMNTCAGIRGAFPASYPIWKPYFPFRIVNWTQKFFLDACWRRRIIVGSW